MANKKRKITQADVYEAYRASQQLSKCNFSHELGISKQSYSAYVHNLSAPSVDDLQWAAVEFRGGWVSELAIDLLVVRGAVVPCVCQTAIGDNGICPKHEVPSVLAVFSEKLAEVEHV